MTAEDWARLKDWFGEAVAAVPARRREMMARLRAESPALADELESLLVAHDSRLLTTIDLTVPPLSAPGAGAAETPPPAAVGPYRVLRELGRGGAGQVFLAERGDDEFHRPVALKLLHRGRPEPEAVTALTLERGSLARMQHGNIATLLDWGTSAEGRPWLATEFIAGERIDAYCRSRHLPEAAILELFAQVTAAVDYAHRHGVVHRDLTPGNILVSPEGVVKLLDFGIAQLAEAELDAAAARRFTPIYASPEQMLSLPATPASDVYSLAMLLGQLLSGALPVDFSRLAPGLVPILRHALEREPGRRYASVAMFRADLDRYATLRPPLGVATSWPRRLRLWSRRHGTATVALALVAAAAAAFGGWRWSQDVPARAAPALAFAPQPVGQPSPALPLTVPRPAPPAAPGAAWTITVVTGGASGLDFSSPDAAACGARFAQQQGCTIHLRFTPTAVGARRGAVVVRDAAGRAVSTQYLEGRGTGPAPGLPTGPPLRVTAGTQQLRGLSVDGAGDLYVNQNLAGAVEEIAAGTAVARVIAHLGIVNGGTAVDGAGNLYVSSSAGQGVYQIVHGQPVRIASVASTAELDDSLTVDGAGNLYLSTYDGSIYVIAAHSRKVTRLLAGDHGHRFVALTSDLAGDVYGADYATSSVYELAVGAAALVRLPGPPGALVNPHAIALAPAGGFFIGENVRNGAVLHLAPASGKMARLGVLGTQGLALDSHGDLFAILNDTQVVEYGSRPRPPQKSPRA